MTTYESPTIIVTAFGPFGPYAVNPSEQVLEVLLNKKEIIEKSQNIKLHLATIPVEYESVDYLVKEIWTNKNPQVSEYNIMSVSFNKI